MGLPSTATDPAGRGPSFARMFLVWVFVGFSLTGFFAGLLDALPLSTLGGGLLLGTALWVAGVRPSLPVAVVYFFVESSLSLILVAGLVSLFGPDSGPAPWLTVAGRGLAIALSGVVVFTGVGSLLLEWVRRRGRSVLELPPREDDVDSR